jgi:hypothetical protein
MRVTKLRKVNMKPLKLSVEPMGNFLGFPI